MVWSEHTAGVMERDPAGWGRRIVHNLDANTLSNSTASNNHPTPELVAVDAPPSPALASPPSSSLSPFDLDESVLPLDEAVLPCFFAPFPSHRNRVFCARTYTDAGLVNYGVGQGHRKAGVRLGGADV